MGDSVKKNLRGTSEDDFTLGDGESFGMRRVGDELRLRDEDVGEHSLADLLAGAGFNPDKLIFTTDGGLVYDSNGIIQVKENA